jgi:hypothetical protein
MLVWKRVIKMLEKLDGAFHPADLIDFFSGPALLGERRRLGTGVLGLETQVANFL